MFEIIENISLKKLNTFGIDVNARFLAKAQSLNDLVQIIHHPIYRARKKLILGGGSNILFTNNFDGIVVKSAISGIEMIDETDDHVYIRVGAGEIWDDLVFYTVSQKWGGLENLSYIPGHVGAAPIQNIGAYGVEAQKCIEYVEYVSVKSGSKQLINNKECQFGYRTSIFKTQLKDQFIITHVTFKLTKHPEFVINYDLVKEELKKHNEVNLLTIRQSIISIRKRKLPEPSTTGNAGSFFKNPVINSRQLTQLKSNFPDIPSYPEPNDCFKIPAAYLIEQIGWKGKTMGRAGVHNEQPLVLVNLGGVTGKEVLELAEAIKESVFKTFGIVLEYEVNIV